MLSLPAPMTVVAQGVFDGARVGDTTSSPARLSAAMRELSRPRSGMDVLIEDHDTPSPKTPLSFGVLDDCRPRSSVASHNRSAASGSSHMLAFDSCAPSILDTDDQTSDKQSTAR